MASIRELEADAAKEVTFNKSMFKISAPKPITSAEDAEGELFSFHPDYWIAANLKKRGRSIKEIYDHFKGIWSMVEISYMLDKIITVNNFMVSRDATILKQQMLEELEFLEKEIWKKEDPADGLDSKDIKVLLQIKDRRIALQGLNAPEKVEVDVNHTIEDSKDKLLDSFDRFIKMRQNSIDVTPKVESAPEDKSTLIAKEENIVV